jgi:hypothetical protein
MPKHILYKFGLDLTGSVRREDPASTQYSDSVLFSVILGTTGR